MKPHYEDTLTQPLTSDDLIEARVSALVGRACRRQIWFLFVDSENMQLPLMIPVADPPAQHTMSGVARPPTPTPLEVTRIPGKPVLPR